MDLHGLEGGSQVLSDTAMKLLHRYGVRFDYILGTGKLVTYDTLSQKMQMKSLIAFLNANVSYIEYGDSYTALFNLFHIALDIIPSKTTSIVIKPFTTLLTQPARINHLLQQHRRSVLAISRLSM